MCSTCAVSRELRGIQQSSGGGRDRRAHYLERNRTLAAHSQRLSCALRGGEDGCVAGVAQHGYDWRQHLPRYALPVVQPVAAVAQELRLLPEERRRLVPCGAGRKLLLGGLLGRYATSAAVPGSGDRDCRTEGLAAGPAGGVLCERRHRASASLSRTKLLREFICPRTLPDGAAAIRSCAFAEASTIRWQGLRSRSSCEEDAWTMRGWRLPRSILRRS